MYILFSIIIILVLWSLVGYFSSGVEQADYKVIRKAKGYEIREYPEHIVAQTTVEGTYRDALTEGFRIVAGYIFGANVKKESIAMTAPVISQVNNSEKISMTAPVLAKTTGNLHTISFGMPRSYLMEALPVPVDNKVKIVKVPTKKFAALRFSWFMTDSHRINMEKKLLILLSRDKVATKGDLIYAGYNPPWTPPWMNRNEIMIEI